MCKTKSLKVKLEIVTPLGEVEKSYETPTIEVIDDTECAKADRLLLYVGDCLYRIDNKGLIIERLVPHERTKEEIKAAHDKIDRWYANSDGYDSGQYL
mgnify:CR=1 FL=1